jgi:hypothetical protein
MDNTEPEQRQPSFEWTTWVQWILATTLGWIVGLAIFNEFGVGLGVGVAQWLVLRRLGPTTVWWTFGSAAGWIAGWVIIVSGFLLPPGVTGLNSVLSGLILGTTTGIGQWLVLRRLVYGAGWWIFASIVGWTVGLTGIGGTSLVGAIVGALTGFMLDFLLRDLREESRADKDV